MSPAPPGPPAGPSRQTALLLVSFLAVLTAVLLIIFVLRLSRKPGAKVTIGGEDFKLGRASVFAPGIARNGPLILPPLQGHLTLYVQHLGGDVNKGWTAFDAHDPAQGPDCFAQWQPNQHDFIDPCDHATFPADGQGLVRYGVDVDKSGDVIVNLRQPLGTATTLPASSTTPTSITTATTPFSTASR